MVIEEKCADEKKDNFVNEFKKEKEEKTGKKSRVDDQLNTDITALDNVVLSVGPALESYNKKKKPFEDSKKEQDDYSKKKTPMINSAIGNKKATVEQIIKTYDEKITNLEKEITLLKTKDIPEAQNQFDAAEKKWKSDGIEPYKKCKDDILQFEESIRNKLKELVDLQNQIEKIEQENQESTIPMMYFLMKEFNDVLNKTVIISADDLALRLHERWIVCDRLKNDKEEKSENLKILINKAESKQRLLDDLRNNRRKDIEELIGKETWEKS